VWDYAGGFGVTGGAGRRVLHGPMLQALGMPNVGRSERQP
jgi:hypothetical protein